MRRWFTVAVLAVCAYLAWEHFVHARPIVRGAGIVAPRMPEQLAFESAPPVFEKDGFRVAALASFRIEARVLHAQSYCCSAPNRLAPIDLALGWGRMSDESVLARLDISQSGRFYYWRYEGAPPIPRREIETSSANMHLIPATATIARRLERLRPGNIVTLRGYLVEVRGEGGFVWRSSLTRDDTGNGACELIWVEELEVG